MRHRHRTVLLTLVLTLTAPLGLFAAPDDGPPRCATSIADLEVARARHDFFQRHLERRRRAGELPGVKTHDSVRQVGDVAVIRDDGTLFLEPKLPDLQGTAMQFLRRPKGVAVVRFASDFKTALGTQLPLGDDDATLVEFPAGFTYPFGGEVYTSVWVNSDGNLTFGEPDTASTARSLTRFLDGPPRIAPLFTDLNPATATGQEGVYLNFLPGRVRVTWFDVPRFGTNNRNTVQVTLFTNGRVTVVYGDNLETDEAVVGVNPFGGAEPLHILDYDEELPVPPQRAAVAEWFPAPISLQVDEFSIGFRFYQHFQDVYDQLVVWYDFDRSLGSNILGGSLAIGNQVLGIGDEPPYDFGFLVGSQGRLKAFVQMAGSIVDGYPEDPDEPAFRAGESTMSLVGHEIGHRWLTRVRFLDQRDGSLSSSLLGRANAHWSFFMDTDASLLEGNDIRDNGDGTFTTRGPVAVRYSALDQYLMGLVPPEAVPPFFYVANAQAGVWDRESNPRAGVNIRGDRIDVTVDDVIAAEGPRVPASENSRKTFRVAFLLVGAPGAEVSRAGIAKLDRFRERFEAYFEEATGGNGRCLTELRPR